MNENDNEVAESADESPLDEATGNNGGAIENESPADLATHEETAAKARGWVPKDVYRGREEDWVDAKSFLDRNGSLKTSVKELEDRLAQKDAEYAERIRRIEAANERIIKEDRERLVRELDKAKRSAVELGDIEEYDRLEREERDYFTRQLQAEREESAPREAKPEKTPLLQETQEWLRRNAWFNEKPHMQQIALGFYSEALEGLPSNRDESKRLAYVDKRMSEVYPDQLGGGNRSNSVEGGTRGLNKPNPISKLSAEERSAMNRFIKRGIIKNEAEYIKYLNEYDS